MEEILKTIIEGLVNNKEAISISKDEKEDVTILKVKVSKDEMGKIIGKQGKIANSIRVLMKSIAAKEQKKVDIEFED